MMRSVGLGTFSLLVLVGCDGDEQALRAWMTQTKASTQAQIVPLPALKEHVSHEYAARTALEPFSHLKIASLNAAAKQAPDGNRPREPLEETPLEAVKMVGVLQKGGQTNALLNVDGRVQQVRVGQYMGQNFGRIMKISEAGITVRELVRDANGEWVSKMTEVKLQSGTSQETKK